MNCVFDRTTPCRKLRKRLAPHGGETLHQERSSDCLVWSRWQERYHFPGERERMAAYRCHDRTSHRSVLEMPYAGREQKQPVCETVRYAERQPGEHFSGKRWSLELIVL
jgi:hypothetical protein